MNPLRVLAAGVDPEDRAALVGELIALMARDAVSALPGTTAGEPEDDGLDRDAEGWPHAMRIDQAVRFCGYSDDHLRTLANAGRVGHRLDGDPTSNAPWVFLRSDLERLMREDRDEFEDRHRFLVASKRGRSRRHATTGGSR